MACSRLSGHSGFALSDRSSTGGSWESCRSHGADADDVATSGETPDSLGLGVGLRSAGVRGDPAPFAVLWLSRGAAAAAFGAGADSAPPGSGAAAAQARLSGMQAECERHRGPTAATAGNAPLKYRRRGLFPASASVLITASS